MTLNACVTIFPALFIVAHVTSIYPETSPVVCGSNNTKKNTSEELTEVLVNFVISLKWRTVTVIYEMPSGILDLDLLVKELHVRGVQTLLLEEQDDDVSHLNTTFVPRSEEIGAYLVLGPLDSVQTVFQRIAQFAEKHSFKNRLLHTEWITVVDRKDILRLEEAVSSFENVAVVATTRDHMSLWTMRREGDATRARLVTSLAGKLRPLTRRQMFPNPQHGLGRRTVRVALREVGLYLFSTFSNGTTVYKGVLMDLLNEISLRLNFTYVIVRAPDDNYGAQLANGTWNGLIGMLTRGEVDLAVADFRLSSDRTAVADPTSPYAYDDPRIIFRRPERDDMKDAWSFFVIPFQSGVYAAIGGSFVGVLAIIVLSKACHYWWTVGRQRALTLWSTMAVWVMEDAGMLLAGMDSKPTRWSESHAGRLLVCTWLLLGVVLTTGYSSKMTSSLTVTDRELPFTSIAELVKQDTYKWGIPANTAAESILKNSTVKEYRQFYQGMLNFARSDPSVRSSDESIQLQKVLAGNYAVLYGSSTVYLEWRKKHCEIAATARVGMTKTEVFYLQKRSPYTVLMSKEIERIVEAGLMSHWTQRWSQVDATPCGQEDEDHSRSAVHLVVVQTAFYFAASGVGLAVLTLGLEWGVRRFRRWGRGTT